jgi:hypothetical protein
MRFKDIWSRLEREALTKDRDKRLKLIELEKEFLDAEGTKILEEEEKELEEWVKSIQGVEDDLKDLYMRQERIRFISRLFSAKPEW